jgi:SAM-dependent methyltransferase
MSIAVDCDISELRETLARIDRSSDASWLARQEKRKVEEAQFHDEKVDRRGLPRQSNELPELKRDNKKYYSTVGKSKNYVRHWIETHAPGKVFLDYACGQGASTRLAARAGARLAIGLDISRGSILNARADATDDGLENTFFLQADCEDTRLPDASVDVMLCSGMLHHLNVEIAFPEIFRILKPGGVCLAMEALDYNPIVKA